MLVTKNLTKSFDDKLVLSAVNYQFDYGINALMGVSGSGKTTLVNLIAGLLSPDSGEIIYPTAHKISMTFQEDRLIEHATALDNVLLPSHHPVRDTPVALDLLSKVGLKAVAHKKVHTLSGGMKRRVSLCRSLLKPFDILILDEPFKGLDKQTKETVMTLLKSLNDGSKIMILITHNEADASFLSARVINKATPMDVYPEGVY